MSATLATAAPSAMLDALPPSPDLAGARAWLAGLARQRSQHQGRAMDLDERDARDGADVTAALGGDGQAFARLVARHQQWVAQQMHRFTRDRGRLEELVQDVFVEAHGSLHTWRERAPFAHWLRRIAVRVGYRHWTTVARERRRREPLLELPPAPDREAAAREVAEWVHALLARLPPRDRLLLTLLSLQQLSVKETAGLTGLSLSLVKVGAFRARRRLARLLEQEPR